MYDIKKIGYDFFLVEMDDLEETVFLIAKFTKDSSQMTRQEIVEKLNGPQYETEYYDRFKTE